MTGITFVGSAIASEAPDTTDMDITMPGGIQAGDVAIIIVRHSRDNASYTFTPTGFTEERYDLFDADTDGAQMATGIYYKVLDGDETTITIDYNPESLDARKGALCFVFRGVDINTPLDVSATKEGDTDGGNDSTPNCPAITPVTHNGALMLVHIPEAGTTAYTAFVAPTTPSGMSTPVSVIAVNGDVINSQIIASYKEDYGVAEVFTPTDWVHTYTGSDFRGYRVYSIALRVAPDLITYVGGSEDHQGFNTTPLVLTQPAHQKDDVGILWCMASASGTLPVWSALTDGWEEYIQDEHETGHDRVWAVYWKRYAHSSEVDPSVNVSINEEHACTLNVFRGVHTEGIPFDVLGTDEEGQNIANPDNPDIYTKRPNAAILLLDSGVQVGAGSLAGPPSGYTLGAHADSNDSIDTENFMATAYLLNAGEPGLIDPGVWTHTLDATTDHSMYTLALRAASPIEVNEEPITFIEKPWATQPPNGTGPSDEYKSGLVFLKNFSSLHAGDEIERLEPDIVDFTQETESFGKYGSGNTMRTTAIAADYYDSLVDPEISGTDKNFSALVLLRPIGVSGVFIGQWDSGNMEKWYFYFSSGSFRFGYGTSLNAITTVGDFEDGNYHVMAFSYRGTTNELRTFKDGVLIDEDTINWTSSGTAGSMPIHMGHRWGGKPTTGLGINAQFALGAVWNDRALTDGEHAHLGTKPWELFKPRRIVRIDDPDPNELVVF